MAITTRHYLWIGHLLVLGLIVWTGVDLSMTFLEARLESAVKNRPAAAAVTDMADQVRSQREYDFIFLNDMFSTEKKPDQTGSAQVSQADSSVSGTALDGLHLLGIIAGSSPELSYAILKRNGQRDQELFKVGDKIERAEVIEIKTGQILVREGGRTLKLTLEESEGESSASNSSGPPRSNRPSAERPAETRFAQAAGPNKFIVDRDILNQDISNLYDFMSQVTIQPNLENEEPHGFKVTSIQRDGIFYQLGLRRNDVVLRLNGVEIGQPEDIMGIYEQIEQLDTLTLDIERGRRPITFTYSLK